MLWTSLDATQFEQAEPRERLTLAWPLSQAGGSVEPVALWMRNVAKPIVS
jgi:hypothetical protein